MSAERRTMIEALSYARLIGRFLDAATSTAALRVDAEGGIVSANTAFAGYVGVRRDDIPGRPAAAFLTEPDGERLGRWLAGATLPDDPVLLNFVALSDSPFTLRCVVGWDHGRLLLLGEPDAAADAAAADELMRLNNELSTMARERARRQRELDRTRRELEATLEELETSYWHLQKIQEVLPVCMQCGKVKTVDLEWQSVIDYLKANDVFLSHGYCPDCADTVLREAGLEGGGS